MFDLKIFVPDSFNTNSYVLHKNGECVIIDPSFSVDKIMAWMDQEKIKPLAIILTHGHYDHIGYSFQIVRKYGIKVFVHELEKPVMERDHLASLFNLTPDIDLSNVVYFNGAELKIKQFVFKVVLCKGHTPGGVSFFIDNSLFTGDTLFYDGVGRVDFPGGNAKELVASINYICDNFSNNVIVYPGHEKSGSLEEIKAVNIFLKRRYR